ncbi:MAG: hypothetical protein ACE1Y2_05570 [Stenotrophomonas maltophilia]
MTTATISPEFDPVMLPVEIKAAEEAGKVWLKQAGQLPILAAMKNVWKITEAPDGGLPQLRMNFLATTEEGRQFRLFQDLLEGKWYRELAPSAPGQP